MAYCSYDQIKIFRKKVREIKKEIDGETNDSSFSRFIQTGEFSNGCFG